MKKIIFLVVFVFLVSLVLGVMESKDMPKADAEMFWKYITEKSPYTEWPFWSDHKGMQPGKAPHGPFHKVYVNHTLLHSEGAPVEYGSIQVKENYSKEKKLMAITTMYKVKGFNPDGGDWFWVKYGSDGKVGASGKLKGCISCHAVKEKNDYILVHDFK
jgi:hypothetical protein